MRPDSVHSDFGALQIIYLLTYLLTYMGAVKLFETSWLHHRYFPKKFSWAFVPIDPVNVRTKFEVRSIQFLR